MVLVNVPPLPFSAPLIGGLASLMLVHSLSSSQRFPALFLGDFLYWRPGCRNGTRKLTLAVLFCITDHWTSLSGVSINSHSILHPRPFLFFADSQYWRLDCRDGTRVRICSSLPCICDCWTEQLEVSTFTSHHPAPFFGDCQWGRLDCRNGECKRTCAALFCTTDCWTSLSDDFLTSFLPMFCRISILTTEL